MLTCKGGLIKNKVWVELFQILQKERLSIAYENQVALGVISQCGPLSCILQNRPSSPFNLEKKRTYLKN